MNALKTYGSEINAALKEAMGDPKRLMLGQDIKDPFGGCYRITSGISTSHPDTVFNTPISEAATVGLGVGLAMQGYKPIIEVMFCNFLTLAADQIFHGQKIHQLIQPFTLTIRTVIGKPDYGFTHEKDEVVKMFEPFIPVFRLALDGDIRGTVKKALETPGISILLEDSSLYTKRVQ